MFIRTSEPSTDHDDALSRAVANIWVPRRHRAAVEAVLRQYTDPYLNQDPVSAGCVRAIDVQGDKVSVQLELGYAAGQIGRAHV